MGLQLLPAGETIIAKKYCEQIINLNAAIQEKQQIEKVSFYRSDHNNARPHVAKKQTSQKLKEVNIETLQHLPYSPDLASSDFHL